MVQDGASPSSTHCGGQGRDQLDPGKRGCIISECVFLLITWSLSPLTSYGPVFILLLEWDVPNLGEIKMSHFKFEKFNSLVCIIL